jgi:hypothetical protein
MHRYISADMETPPQGWGGPWERNNWPIALWLIAPTDDMEPTQALAYLEAISEPMVRHGLVQHAIRNARDATPLGIEILRDRLATYEREAKLPHVPSQYAVGTEMENTLASVWAADCRAVLNAALRRAEVRRVAA